MSMIIAHNMSAINTKRNFAYSSRGMSSSMEKLSSGYKINTGKDDPSGLIISEKLRSQLNGLKRAQQNTEEAINVMGIAEGALNEMNSILKKMKALAIHAANNGVTSPDQVAADQAEMDSSIQTLDRIAQTTKFSDQNLLNGAKDIAFEQDTLIKSTQQNSLLNARESHFSQIFKRDGYSVSFNFTGTKEGDAVTGVGEVDFSQQTMKAYLELDTAADPFNRAQVKDGLFTQAQAFTLTGSKGSRAFKFKQGDSVTSMVSQIKSTADSTGIDAALVFNSSQNIDRLSGNGPARTDFDITATIDGIYSDANPDSRAVFKFSAATPGQEEAAFEELQKALDGKELKLSIELDNATAGNAAAATAKIVATVNGKTYTLGETEDPNAAISVSPIAITPANDDIAKALNKFNLDVPAIDVVKSFTANATTTVTAGTLTPGDKLLTPGAANDGKIEVDLSAVDIKQVAASITDPDLREAFLVAAGSNDLSVQVEVVSPVGTLANAYSLKFHIVNQTDPNTVYYSSEALSAVDLGIDTTGARASGAITNTKLGPLSGMTLEISLGGAAIGSTTTMTGKLAPPAAITAATTYVATPNTAKAGMVSLSPQAATQAGGAAADASAARQAGTVAVFNNTLKKDGSGAVEQGVCSVEVDDVGPPIGRASDSILYGYNTDGQGRLYIKFLDDNSFELYKDSSLTEESKVATGINGEEIKATNNSGLEGFTLNLAGSNLSAKKGVYISLAGIEGHSLTGTAPSQTEGVVYNGVVAGTSSTGNYDGTGMFDADKTLITGVELGKNTSEEGSIYLKNVYDHDKGTVQVFAYKHKDMKDEDMVAKSEPYSTTIVDGNGDTVDVASLTVILNEVRNSDNTLGTGLGIVLSVDGEAFSGMTKSSTLTGNITFTNLGARLFAQDYGSEHFLKITQDKGAIFTQYGTPGDNDSGRLIDAGEKGTAVEIRGQDASLSVNGQEVRTNGLKLSMATQDIQASLVFNQGKVGSTTLAQVGYEIGSIFTKIGVLNLGSAEALATGKYAGLSGLLCNAGHVTTEKITDFQNGMQLQLGEGPGDQDRTIVAIKSLTAENLGRVVKGGYWETGNCVWSEKTFTMKDVMGGGLASLSTDPILSMSIIDKAISDVSETRALIGAVQANLLQTNSNNLSVTMENITKTESGIRDADMADEMTEFTKNQVLQNAGISMMAQANASSQSVLQLLQ